MLLVIQCHMGKEMSLSVFPNQAHLLCCWSALTRYYLCALLFSSHSQTQFFHHVNTWVFSDTDMHSPHMGV
jgi:hypothetical protein